LYITKLTIRDLRTIHECAVDFCVPAGDASSTTVDDSRPLANVTLLLGINGAGKTTILRAIALGALAPLLPQSSGYVPRTMVRRVGGSAAPFAEVTAELSLHEQDGAAGPHTSGIRLLPIPESYQDRFDTIPEPEWAQGLWKERGPAFFMVGYGASRRVDSKDAFGSQAQEKERHLRYHRVAGLFEESVVMRPLSSWLPNWDNPGRRKQLIDAFNKIVPDVDLVDEPVDGEYLFRMGNAELPFDALSDGYRAFIGWVTDLLYHVSRGIPPGAMLFEARGVVMVDEVDLHLHPSWQRMVIPRLARAMPNMQFVFTSHSPLLVGTLHRENIRVLRAGPNGSIAEPAEIEVHGLSSDQILTSAYFGLDSTREPGFTDQLHDVASKARQGDADSAELFLRMLSLGSDAGTAAPPRAARSKDLGG
jgi:AAA domain, putative AbiEii toxin, Type IV TA system